ncbi:MAG: hypothetical protein ACK2UU_10005 [Anaerolineae bacterium]|jgi:hypothetical protein
MNKGFKCAVGYGMLLILLAELIMGSVLVLYGRRRVRGKGN